MLDKLPLLLTDYPLCIHASKVYTPNELAQLTLTTELGEISEAADATRVDGALMMVAKEFKTWEPKHRGNKRLKSVLEQRKKSAA
ncbi:hypothetical protein CJ030_MR1G017593 [Morella rubra]|uniref:Uncharacterized protein n=1 Tax=Morella rubra TaxID=262757 RepID=A0A6A1WR70_9ROSI|nr:hypothetical protein CJ030_MR1G017593 [Morella rubra]